MKDRGREIKICPICGKEYVGYGALSRVDNTTYICSDCGTRQALDSLDISSKEQEEILGIIHRYVDEK